MRGLLIVLAFLVVNVVAEIADFKDWKVSLKLAYYSKQKLFTNQKISIVIDRLSTAKTIRTKRKRRLRLKKLTRRMSRRSKSTTAILK